MKRLAEPQKKSAQQLRKVSKTAEESEVTQLPLELLALIFQELSCTHLPLLSCVCTSFKKVADWLAGSITRLVLTTRQAGLAAYFPNCSHVELQLDAEWDPNVSRALSTLSCLCLPSLTLCSVQPPIRDFSFAPPLQPYFNYRCSLLTRLEVYSAAEGCVCAQHERLFTAFAAEHFPNLQELLLDRGLHGEECAFVTLAKNCLPQLQRLEIGSREQLEKYTVEANHNTASCVLSRGVPHIGVKFQLQTLKLLVFDSGGKGMFWLFSVGTGIATHLQHLELAVDLHSLLFVRKQKIAVSGELWALVGLRQLQTLVTHSSKPWLYRWRNGYETVEYQEALQKCLLSLPAPFRALWQVRFYALLPCSTTLCSAAVFRQAGIRCTVRPRS